MNITLVAALGQNRIIGGNNQMLWHLPNDFRYFRKLTLHHTVVMGRNTWLSLGKPLPQRRNWVLSTTLVSKPGMEVFPHWEALLERYQGQSEEIFVIGGGQIYTQALPLAKRMVLTHVEASPQGDAYFPEWDPNQWHFVERLRQNVDERHAHGFVIRDWRRNEG
jgi:dihydrofolate reductase